ncbi:MAG: hypothetical protein ACKVS8_08675 [Phycisphaerales bacterium]
MRLRIHNEPAEHEEHRLVFPRAALDQLWGRSRNEPAGRGFEDDILHTLDFMQRRLNDLREDVEAYRFPVFDDRRDPPPMAA